MSIKIHYGPLGSYKTSGALMDDLIPAWLEGRTIITNVRGVSRDRFQAAGLDPDDKGGEVISINGDTIEGLRRIATFFHWAPRGALIFVDEASTVWPKHQKDIAYPFPGGVDEAERLDMPRDFFHAFEMSRHWNWDFVLTTPNIAKIRPEIRECADGAYKHKNQALIGLKGRYLEAVHAPTDTGNSESQYTSVNARKIKPYVWECYDSTKTGVVSDTISGRAFWKNPRVVVLALFLAGAFYFATSRPMPAVLSGKHSASLGGSSVAVQSNDSAVGRREAVVTRPSPENRSSPPGLSGGVLPVSVANAGALSRPSVVDPFQSVSFSISGVLRGASETLYMFVMSSPDRDDVTLTTRQLVDMGVAVQPRGDCMAVLRYAGLERAVLCGGLQRSGAGSTSSSFGAASPQLPVQRSEAVVSAPGQTIDQVSFIKAPERLSLSSSSPKK